MITTRVDEGEGSRAGFNCNPSLSKSMITTYLRILGIMDIIYCQGTNSYQLAQRKACNGLKVCWVDIDYSRSETPYCLPWSAEKFLDEYLVRDPMSPNLPTVEEMLNTYSDNLYIIARKLIDIPNLGDATLIAERGKLLSRLPNILEPRLHILAKELEQRKFDLVIFNRGNFDERSTVGT